MSRFVQVVLLLYLCNPTLSFDFRQWQDVHNGVAAKISRLSRACDNDTYTIGHWKHTPIESYDTCTNVFQALYPTRPNLIHLYNCANRSSSEYERTRESISWTWEPDTCKLHPFNKHKVSKWLQNHKIFYVGDSIQTDMKQSMDCLLSGTGRTFPNQTPNLERNVQNHRMDFLGCADHDCVDISIVQQEWKKFVSMFSPTDNDILVINTGAHWYRDPKEVSGAFQKVTAAIADVFNGTLVFRTTVMGHESCQHFTGPNTNATKRGTLYNWKDFRAINEVVDQAFRSTQAQYAYHLLNVSMFEQRGDGHRQKERPEDSGDPDCLHYCVPGPQNDWNRLLYHVLYDHF